MKKIFLAITNLVPALVAHAQGGSPTLTEPTNLFSSSSDIQNFFCGILQWMFWGLIVLSIAMFLVGAYSYATSSGDAEKVSKANKTLLYAAIGIIVALLAKAIPIIIGSFFGAKGIENACP